MSKKFRFTTNIRLALTTIISLVACQGNGGESLLAESGFTVPTENITSISYSNSAWGLPSVYESLRIGFVADGSSHITASTDQTDCSVYELSSDEFADNLRVLLAKSMVLKDPNGYVLGDQPVTMIKVTYDSWTTKTYFLGTGHGDRPCLSNFEEIAKLINEKHKAMQSLNKQCPSDNIPVAQ